MINRGLRRLQSVLMLISLLVAVPRLAVAQELGRLRGKIETLPHEMPVQGLAVALMSLSLESSRTTYDAVTNEHGMFQIDLPPGSYEVALSMLGFYPVVDTVDVAPGSGTVFNRKMSLAVDEMMDELIVPVNRGPTRRFLQTPRMSRRQVSGSTGPSQP